MLRLLATALVATPLVAAAAPPAAGVSVGVAGCVEAVSGNPPAGRGPIKFFEYRGWAESAVEKPDGTWDVKMGAAVRGGDPVTVRVVPRHQDRAALVYGGRTPRSAVRFEPCADHTRSTGWAGGVRLTKLRRFTVEIRMGDEAPIREVLLDLPRGFAPSAGSDGGG